MVPGGQRLILEPQVPVREKLDWVKGELQTQHGTVRSSWRKEGDSLLWEFSIPANMTAEVCFPAAIDKNKVKGCFLRTTVDQPVYEMGAGSYRFEM
jgi:alpha-L-rhamnosidase